MVKMTVLEIAVFEADSFYNKQGNLKRSRMVFSRRKTNLEDYMSKVKSDLKFFDFESLKIAIKIFKNRKIFFSKQVTFRFK